MWTLRKSKYRTQLLLELREMTQGQNKDLGRDLAPSQGGDEDLTGEVVATTGTHSLPETKNFASIDQTEQVFEQLSFRVAQKVLDGTNRLELISEYGLLRSQ